MKGNEKTGHKFLSREYLKHFDVMTFKAHAAKWKGKENNFLTKCKNRGCEYDRIRLTILKNER
jgi:hypothetical protein